MKTSFFRGFSWILRTLKGVSEIYFPIEILARIDK